MGVINSIESSFDGVTIPVKNTIFHMRLIGGEITNIIGIIEIGEMWQEQLSARVLKYTLKQLNDMAIILKVQPIMCFEYLDKHTYTVTDKIDLSDKDEYKYIYKENMLEIKGGKYKTNENIA